MSEAEILQEYEVLDRARKNPQAFGELYEKYFDRIFNFVYRQTDDEDLTADLTSQTFFTALKKCRPIPIQRSTFFSLAL